MSFFTAVKITGASGGTLDAVITEATAPANALAVLSVNQTTAPSLTVGQSVARQCDYQGSVFVKPYRRGQTAGQASTISSSSVAVTCVTNAATGIFADVATVVLTCTPAATTDLAFTVTLSDGTANYVFDMDTGALATSVAPPGQLTITFNPPLPATTAATNWTIATNVNTVVVHCVVVYVKQKAS